MPVKKGDRLYLPQYALTDGCIYAVNAKVDEKNGGYVFLEGSAFQPFQSYKIGRDVFVDEQGAIQEAEALRAKKIKALETKLMSVKEMSFVIKQKKDFDF